MRVIAGIAIWITLALGCGSKSKLVDDGGVDVGTSDASAVGQFGDPCTMHTDCTSGYCVEPVGGAGGVCSRVCNGDCPAGYDCLPVDFPNAEVKLCVPSTARLCSRCVSDAECPGGICTTIDSETRCAAACSGNEQCPLGYTCAPEAGGAHPGKFCQPVTASCTCSAEMAGAMRTCTNSNAIGTCLGTQMCSPATGWSACTAATAVAETCDGVDNDCNFVIDNGVGGGQACTNTVAGVGSCPGVRTCGGSQGFICQGQIPTVEKCNGLDDNCNGTVDEGFAGLGNSCSVGVGACARFGTIRCNTLGTGTECSATAGAAGTETCNHIDDDCDNKTDENFTTLGQQCSAGQGVCQRFGSFVCDTMGGVTCSATAGPPQPTDTCNFVDDDCDGKVDENFRDPMTGFYDTDTNCGTCGNDCTNVFNGPNASGICVVTVQPLCEMTCAPNTADLNSSTVDGCEFVLDAAAVYVSINDATAADDATCGIGPAGTGAGNHPCKSIAQGIARATTLVRSKVDIADGTYNEAITMVAGKNLFGGFRSDTWERHLATTSTVIQGVSSSGNHDRTVIASAITTATILEGFVIRGSSNTKPGGNSYAIYISGSNANLVIRDNQIVAGRGGPGAAGASGTNGTAGVDGGPYVASQYDSYGASGSGTCNSNNNRGAYGGGANMCGADDVSGGGGGGNNCTPARSTQNSTATAPGLPGQAGAGAGGGAAGAAGTRGFDGDHVNNICLLPVSGNQTLPMFGTDGKIGGNGGNATGVGGCSAPTNSVVGGHWVGNSGAPGTVGSNGGGGGGGGAGAGATVETCVVFCTAGRADLGSHGGGGGSGGCGGNGGGAGGTGGGVFGIFITGGTAPSITNNSISGGTGGDGGAGGVGGAGGLGGAGSQGGVTGTFFCTGKGGRGGDGGNGGAGGGGGGGCGGSEFGIFTAGIGTPAYCGSNSVTAGAAGGGGSGGSSAGNSGGAGVAGAAAACTSI